MKKALLFSLLILGGFYIAPHASAYSQPLFKGVLEYVGTSPTSIRYINAITNTNYDFWGGSVGNPASAYFASTSKEFLGGLGNIGTVTIYVRNVSSTTGSSYLSITCVDGTGSHTGNSDGLTTLISGFFEHYTYVWTTPVTCNAATLTSLQIGFGGELVSLDRYQIGATDNAPNPSMDIGITNGSGLFDYLTRYTLSINENLIIDTSQLAAPVVESCGSTNFVVATVDFGKGFCNLVRFLLVPPTGVTDILVAQETQLQDKIPFSYFYEIQQIVSNSSTTTATSTPSVALTTSATSSIPNLNVVMFSSSTIGQVAAFPGIGLLRTLAKVFLYIGFAMMCYYTGVSLLKKGDKK